MLPESVRGGRYEGLYHVSDWFPTILGMVNVRFTPKTGFELDGFDQYNALLTLTTAADVAEADGSTDERGGARGGGGVDRFSPLVSSSGARRGLTPADNNNKGPINMAPYKPPTSTTSSSSYPRAYILYNYYYNVEGQAFDFMTRYASSQPILHKTIHTYKLSTRPALTYYNCYSITIISPFLTHLPSQIIAYSPTHSISHDHSPSHSYHHTTPQGGGSHSQRQIQTLAHIFVV